MNLRQLLIPIILSILVSSCALFSSSSGKPTLPKAESKIKVPEGRGENWRYIGTTNDGILVIEINNSSIIKSTTTPYLITFSDRKTVVDTEQFSYPTNQPHFKYLINSWQFDCLNKKYIVLNAKMYNQQAKEIGNYDYTNDPSVKWIAFGDGSIAELEYKFVCLNQNRNLGY